MRLVKSLVTAGIVQMIGPVPVPVLEVGGTHVTAALVHRHGLGVVVGSTQRRPLAAMQSADEIVAELVLATSRVSAPAHATWGVAIPGPFDYERGIGLFRGVGKFDALYGVDLRRRLLKSVRPEPADIRFLNDADAFAIGEWSVGAARGHARIIAITLGTGIGSSFLDRGRPVRNGADVPPDGHVYRLSIDGQPLEEKVSRRAILDRYRALGGDAPEGIDVRDLAELARHGDPIAANALSGPLEALGSALAPWVVRFQASMVVVGGGMAGSWGIVGPPLARGLHSGVHGRAFALLQASNSTDAALIGAAMHASCTAADASALQHHV